MGKKWILWPALILMTYGGCEGIKYSSSKPIRDICELFTMGGDFSAQIAVREVMAHGISAASFRGENSVMINRANATEAQSVAALIDEKKSDGEFSATIAVGFPKFSCRIEFAGGKVRSQKMYWWD